MDVQKTAPETLALSTKLEEQFVSPLTAIRGGLEILRDFPDLPPGERRKFVDAALSQCARIEQGVRELGVSVYGRGQAATPVDPQFADRIRKLEDRSVIDVDFSGFTFTSTQSVDAFFDAIDRTVIESRAKWWFIFNIRDSHVWPEAWVAHAHRSKKVSVGFAQGLVRYWDGTEDGAAPPAEIEPSRAAALAKIEEMKREEG